MTKADKDTGVILALAEGADGLPLIIFGVSRAAFEHLLITKESSEFNLINIGLPIKLVMFATETADEAKQIILKAAPDAADVTEVDFSIIEAGNQDIH